jgi:hypothetical protein
VTAKGTPFAIGEGEAKELAPAGIAADDTSWLPANLVKLTVSPSVIVTEAALYWLPLDKFAFWPTCTVTVDTASTASLR